MTGMRFAPRGYGGRRRSPDEVKREGWREQGLLAVSVDDERLSWPERELVRQLGQKLLSYDFFRLPGKREPLPGTAFMPGSGGGWVERSWVSKRRAVV